MAVKVSNNAVSTLAANIAAAATTLSVASADAGKFPDIATGAGHWFPMTIVDASGNMEVVRVTARNGATMTVVRGQEGTTAKAFTAGARCDLRLTSASLTAMFSDFLAGLGPLATVNIAPVANGGTGGATVGQARTNLGLGTAATRDVGTEGSVLAALNLSNTWSGAQTYTATVTINAATARLVLKGDQGEARIDAASDADVMRIRNAANTTVFQLDMQTGNLSLFGALGIGSGGTGAVTAPAARAALGTDNASNLTEGTVPGGRLNGSYTGINRVGALDAGGSGVGAVSGSTAFTIEGNGFVYSNALLRINDLRGAGASNTDYLIRFQREGTTVGGITNSTTSVAYNTTSDETWKEFIGPYDPDLAIAIIRADPVREWNWRGDLGGGWAVGWGAQTSHAVSADLGTEGGWFFSMSGAPASEYETRFIDPLTREPCDEMMTRIINQRTGEPTTEEDPEAMVITAVVDVAEYRPWGVDQSKRTPYLWAAVSRILDRADQLELLVQQLSSRLEALETAA